MLAPGNLSRCRKEGCPLGDVNREPVRMPQPPSPHLHPQRLLRLLPRTRPKHLLTNIHWRIVSIVIKGIVVAVFIVGLFFLLERQKTMLQFIRRTLFQAPGAHNPPEQQPDIRSSPSQMTSFPVHSGLTHSETPNYHDPAYDTLFTHMQHKILWSSHNAP